MITCSCGKQYNDAGLRPGTKLKCRICGSDILITKTQQEAKPISEIIMLGRFQLLKELNDSGTSKVYFAKDTSMDRDVAIKVMKGRMSDNTRLRGRFKQEVHTAAKINDENVGQVLEAGFEGEVGYIVMEYIEGKSVRELLKKYKALPFRTAAQLVHQVAKGLHVVHIQGIIHRDIKPDNLFLATNGKVKIMDFGFARDMEEEGTRLTHVGQMIGTYHYMSPEQIDSSSADARADIYALGITFYELIAGKVPFDAPSALTIVQKHQKEPLPDIRLVAPDIPDELVRILEKMTAKDPEKRYQTAGEIVVELGAAVKKL